MTTSTQDLAAELPVGLLLDIARVAHGAVLAIQVADKDPAPAPPWEEMTPGQCESAADGIRRTMALARPGDTWDLWAEREWRRWSAQKRAAGWEWGPVKDPAAKTNPCLTRTYAEVPAIQVAKDLVRIAAIESFLAIYRARG